MPLCEDTGHEPSQLCPFSQKVILQFLPLCVASQGYDQCDHGDNMPSKEFLGFGKVIAP